jgi:hypothetical protein
MAVSLGAFMALPFQAKYGARYGGKLSRFQRSLADLMREL